MYLSGTIKAGVSALLVLIHSFRWLEVHGCSLLVQNRELKSPKWSVRHSRWLVHSNLDFISSSSTYDSEDCARGRQKCVLWRSIISEDLEFQCAGRGLARIVDGSSMVIPCNQYN